MSRGSAMVVVVRASLLRRAPRLSRVHGVCVGQWFGLRGDDKVCLAMHDAADDGRVRIVRCDEVDLPPPRYQQMMDRLLKVQENKSSKNRRRASRQNDLKERGYSLPQIQIIQEPTSTRRIGGL